MSEKERTLSLLRAAKTGDNDAMSELVRENMGLVKSIALRFRGRGQELEDLVQIGSVGMMRAIKGFDESFGTVFSTYAVHMITGELRRFLRDDGMIKVSREIKRKGYVIYKKREEFTAQHGREPTVSELCDICEMTKEEIILSLEASSPTVSLQERIGDDDSSCLEEFIGVDTSDEIDEKLTLRDAISSLEPDERTLIFLRYYKGMTQNESAKRLGMTQVKVSRKEKKIIEKLKEKMSVSV